MDTWHHSGFHVYCGDVIRPDDEEGLERLAHYVIRALISQERMVYIAASEGTCGMGQVIYTGKSRKNREHYTALDWLSGIKRAKPLGKGSGWLSIPDNINGYFSPASSFRVSSSSTL